MRSLPLATLLLVSTSLAACSTWKPPEISYDDTPKQAVLQPDPPKPVQIVELPKPLPLPGQLKRLPGSTKTPPELSRSARARRPGEWRGPNPADAGRLSQRHSGLSVL